MSANYNESAVQGTTYFRCPRIIIENGLSHKMIHFDEERVFDTDAGPITQRYDRIGSPLGADFTDENVGTMFDMLDPSTGLPVGSQMSYGEVYAVLHSLYLHFATTRDAEMAEFEATIPNTVDEQEG